MSEATTVSGAAATTRSLTLEALLESVVDRLEASDVFYGHGTDNSWDEAVYLVFCALGIDFGSDDSVFARVLEAGEVARVEELLRRRIEERVPVAYLVGEAWFAGTPFRIDERALIPRSPIAELIQQRFATLIRDTPRRILDLCTGSGCIGIACALNFKDAEVDLADISAAALELARENVRRYQLEQRVRCLESDLFRGLAGADRYDLIVCNPPYVSREEIESLPPEYRREPELGLLSDDEGLAIPLRILREAPYWLEENGVLILEVGYSRDALAQRLPEGSLTWLEFANGGDGVCMVSREQLLDLRPLLLA